MRIKHPELSLDQARGLALDSHLYKQHQLEGKEGVRELIRQLGYVQLDTISVVERAHHHSIWTRINSYDKAWLDQLLEHDRAVFEYWGHAASYLPMENYRYSLPRMERFPDTSGWERRFFDLHKHLFQDILARVKAEGPLGARDFPDTREVKANFGWGTGKPEKIALELLMWKGDLMVHRRDKFQRVYDLRERVLPAWVDTSQPSGEELYRHLILRSLAALGIATASDIRGHYVFGDKDLYSKYLAALEENRELVRVRVEGLTDDYFILPASLDNLDIYKSPSDEVFLLSPLDSLIIQRGRLKRLFGFDYTLECYVPPHKRVYGYWCLPILYRQNFIGRLDCKANRAKQRMELLSLHWEPGFRPDARAKKALQKTFDAFAAFCGCQSARLS